MRCLTSATGETGGGPGPPHAPAAARSTTPGQARHTPTLPTGHGERRYDPVMQTQFERVSSRPNQRIALYYDSYEALVAKGAKIAKSDATMVSGVTDPRGKAIIKKAMGG